MATAGVTYKTLAPGCTVEVRPYTPAPGEERLVQSSRRKAKASAGLTVEASLSFPVGSLVVLDLTFPGQSFTYRSRGTVSWVAPSPRGDGLYTLGVLVFGMDKLDSVGINVSRAPAFLPMSLAPADPAPIEPSTSAPEPRTMEARGALVSLCAVDLKIARWMGTAMDGPAPTAIAPREPTLHERRAALEAEGKAAPTRPPSSPWEVSAPAATPPPQTKPRAVPSIAPVRPSGPRASRPPAKDAVPVRKSPPSTPAFDPLGSTMLAGPSPSRPPRPSGRRTSEIPVVALDQRHEAEPEFDAEQGTIDAFERIHELYGCEDRVSAAAFVLRLARQLVRCEAAVCWLIAEKTPRLEAVAAEGSAGRRIEGARLELGAALVGKSVREGRLIRSVQPTDTRTYEVPPYGPAGLGAAVRSVLVAPVMRDGHTVGAIELLGSPRRAGFAQGEANVLSYLCVALAEHIDTSLPLDNGET